MARRTWTDDDLRAAVAATTSLHATIRHLGLVPGGSAWRRMQEHVVRLDLDTSHWVDHGVRPGVRPAPRAPAIDDDLLRELLPAATSLAEVLRGLGIDPASGSARQRLRRRITALGLTTDHLAGQGWARGRPGRGGRAPRPLDEVLVRDSPYRGRSSALRDRLVREGVLEWRCAWCGLDHWNDRRAPLQLDHVNGDPSDNRRQNLRLLCPNCHAQTPTWCGRNIGGGYSSRPDGDV